MSETNNTEDKVELNSDEVVEETKTEAEETKAEVEETKTEAEETKTEVEEEIAAAVGYAEPVNLGALSPEETEKLERKARRKTAFLKFLKVSCITIVATVVIAYLGIAIWFKYHYNNNTIINGINVSYQSTETVREMIQSNIDDYKVTVKLRNNETHELSAADVDLLLVSDFSENAILKEQNFLLWPFHINDVKEYTVMYAAQYNEEKLGELIDTYPCTKEENMIAPVNAKVDFEDGKPVIIKETDGTILDRDMLVEEVKAGLDKGLTVIDLTDSEIYKVADVTEDSQKIADIYKKAQKMTDMVIHIVVGQKEMTLKSETFADWMNYNYGKEKWTFLEKRVQPYIKEMADTFNTVGTTRKFRTHNYKTVKISGDEYGWLLDEEAELASLTAELNKGITTWHQPEFTMSAETLNDDNDIGNTYVEVDLTMQHVYVYVKGELVLDSDCVTGCQNNRTNTPDGLYGLYHKKSPAILKGADYETKVTFWMPFNGGIGLHDATWRRKFGGEIYITDGSHGCVNLPYDVARDVYEIVYPGMPIVCHY